MIDGSLTVDTFGQLRAIAGDYRFIPGRHDPTAFRNTSGADANRAGMKAPLPRERLDIEVLFPDALGARPLHPIDVRDSRTRYFGHINAERVGVAGTGGQRQRADRLARVQRGITVKMMVDSDLDGANAEAASTAPLGGWDRATWRGCCQQVSRASLTPPAP